FDEDVAIAASGELVEAEGEVDLLGAGEDDVRDPLGSGVAVPRCLDGQHDGPHLGSSEEVALPVEVGAAGDDGDGWDWGLAPRDAGRPASLVELRGTVLLGAHGAGTNDDDIGEG